MEIIAPNSDISKAVKELKPDTEKEICEMEKMMEKNNFKNNRTGLAVAHCQVSENPLRIFVAKEMILPHNVVINPVITERQEPYTAKEFCLSFPFGGEYPITRYHKITVQYQDRYMQNHLKRLEGIQAQIFQHEIDHFNGINIYGEKF